MGTIGSERDPVRDLTVVTVTGQVTADQILDQIITFLTGDPTKLVLWDLTRGSIADISSNDLAMIAERGAEHTHRRRGGKTALVALKAVNYGLSRMFQTFANLCQKDVMFEVFDNVDEARAWLFRR